MGGGRKQAADEEKKQQTGNQMGFTKEEMHGVPEAKTNVVL